MHADSSNANSIRISTTHRRNLRRLNQSLKTQVEALIEDNKQLRAALRIYSEVARQCPSSLALQQVA